MSSLKPEFYIVPVLPVNGESTPLTNLANLAFLATQAGTHRWATAEEVFQLLYRDDPANTNLNLMLKLGENLNQPQAFYTWKKGWVELRKEKNTITTKLNVHKASQSSEITVFILVKIQ